MGTTHDYFAILGLTPQRYAPAEIARRFQIERSRTLRDLERPTTHEAARQRLDELYKARNALIDPRSQAEDLAARNEGESALDRLRRLIEASLEGGLLRHSRRREILAEGYRLGFSDFHTQLLIAQVQFGQLELLPVGRVRQRPAPGAGAVTRVGARLAAAGMLALALFFATIRWLAH